MSRLSDEEIAVHEAGHAVMSLIEGLPFTFVSINKAGDLDGLVDPGDEFRQFEDRILRYRLVTVDDVSLIKRYVKVIYAGPMSHGLYLEVPQWWTYLRGGNDDLHAYQLMEVAFRVEPLITEMCSDLKLETMLEISKEDTMEKINKVALALLDRRRLTHQECKDLL